MRMHWIASAAVVTGLTTLVPTVSQAAVRPARVAPPVSAQLSHHNDGDRNRGDDHGRHSDREWHIRAIDRPVDLCDVPSCVIQTAQRVSRGSDVESARYVSVNGSAYFVIRVDRHHGGDMTLRITVDGRLIDAQG